jgi:hypothetical protein
MRQERNAYRVLVRKFEGNGPLGKPRLRWRSIIISTHKPSTDPLLYFIALEGCYEKNLT